MAPTGFLARLARLPAQALIAIVRAYRFFLSPWLGSACRFEPTCSAYSLQALQRHGALVGSYLTVHRLVRCGPWCEGGHDPVPDRIERRAGAGLFTDRVGLPARPAASTRISQTDKTAP